MNGANVIKCLLVEDNAGDAWLIGEMLSDVKSVGVELTHVTMLSDAISMLESGAFDVVLVDMSLPDSIWPHTLTRVVESFPEMPVVVLTGLNDEERAVNAVQKGAQDYLVKDRISGDLLSKAIVYAMERKKIENEQKRLISELKDALAKVKLLSGMIPICASCKKIRDDQGYWTQIEAYIREHSEAEFTHGICPDCMKRLYPNLCGKKRPE